MTGHFWYMLSQISILCDVAAMYILSFGNNVVLLPPFIKNDVGSVCDAKQSTKDTKMDGSEPSRSSSALLDFEGPSSMRGLIPRAVECHKKSAQ